MLFFSFICLISIVGLVASKTFELPKVSFIDLLAFDPDAISSLKEHLLTLGAVQMTDIPKFRDAREKALSGSASCLRESKEELGIFQRTMNDGSKRFSVAASTKNGIQDPFMSNHCGDSAKTLRALIDSACRQVFLTLDSLVSKDHQEQQHVMLPSYSTFTELMSKGNHLEHLHSYFPSDKAISPSPSSPSSSSSSLTAETMRLHTDNGLMIAMTTGFYENGRPTESSGLYLSLPSEEEVLVSAADDSLILLMGEGGSKWLEPVLGKAFRAVPHSLRLDFQSLSSAEQEGISRSWFGKMFLPPSDAMIPPFQIPYSQYHQEEMSPSSPYFPLACESSGTDLTQRNLRSSSGSYGSIFVQDSSCPSGDMMCWAQCQSVSNLACGMDAVCTNLQTGQPEAGSDHCMGDANYPNGIYCVLQCPAGWNDTSSDNNDYCYGDGTSMSMTGFFSIVEDTKGTTPCVNLLFEEWTLDNSVKFGFACVGVLLIGIFVQYLTLLKTQLKTFPWIIENQLIYRFSKMIVFGIQILLSYFLMLIAMTYSVELFTMVVLGLTLGYGLFGTLLPENEEPSPEPCCPPENYEITTKLIPGK